MSTFDDRRQQLYLARKGKLPKETSPVTGLTRSTVPAPVMEEFNKPKETKPVPSKSSLYDRRDAVLKKMKGQVVPTVKAPTPEKTKEDKLQTNISNYQERMNFEGVDYEPQESFLKKSGNNLLKALDIIDRPRNAVWNAVKTGRETFQETGSEFEGLKGFGSGFVKGLTAEERYTGTDLAEDLLGPAKTTGEKVRNFGVALGTEMVLDPLNLVTLGAGKLLKGALTGKGATLSDDAIKSIARAATAPITPDNINRGLKVVFDNPDALVKTGAFSADVAKDMKTVKQFANNIFEYNDMLTSIKKATKEGAKEADKLFLKELATNSFEPVSDVVRAFKNVEEPIDIASRGFLEGALGKSLGQYGMKPETIRRFTEHINLKDVRDVADTFAEPLQQYLVKDVIGGTQNLIRGSAELGGPGLSLMGKTFKTGAQLQDIGAGVASRIRDYGIMSDGALSTVARGVTNTQDAVQSVFSKYFVKGASREQSKMFKAIISNVENAKGLTDADTIEKVVRYQNRIVDQVTKDYPTLSGNALLKKIEGFEKSVTDFIELGEKSEVMTKLFNEVTPEMNMVIRQLGEDVQRDLARMGLDEAHIGKLNNIMEGYMPHVRNTKLKRLTPEELRNVNPRYRLEEDAAETLARHTGQSGKSVGMDFSASNTAGRRRVYNTAIDYANNIKKLNSSSPEAAEDFFNAIYKADPELHKSLTKGGWTFDRSGSYGIKTMTEDPEILQSLMDRIPPDLWSETLDGVDNFFETSALKGLLVRELQHNRVIAQADTARDILYSLGRPLNKFDKEAIRDYRSRGWDIVVTKGYFEDLSTKDLETLTAAAGESAEVISRMMRNAMGSTAENMRPLSGADVETLLDIFSQTKVPLEVFAVPQSVRKTYNNVARHQMDEGFRTVGNLIDSLHRKWKPLVTGYRPDFHARNYISSTMNDMLDNGVKSLQPKYKLMASKIARQTDDVIEISGQSFEAKEIYRAMKETGALSNMTRDLAPDALDDAIKHKLKISDKKFTEKILNVYESAGHKVGNIVEDNLRANNFVINMERALDAGMESKQAMRYASEKVKEFHFDYTDLSEVERRLLRRITPFYTWARKNIPLQLEQFFDNPAMYGKVGDVVNMSADAFGNDLQNMPEWAQGTLPISTPFKTEDGRNIAVSGLFPQSDLQQVLGGPKDFIQGQLAGISPVLKAPMEVTMNRNFLTGAPIYRTEAEKNQKLAEYALGQTGAFRDATRTITQQGAPTGEYSAAFPQMPLGIGGSLVKGYDEDKATYNRGQEYNRYLADILQGYANNDQPLITIPEIRKLEKLMESVPDLVNNKKKSLIEQREKKR